LTNISRIILLKVTGERIKHDDRVRRTSPLHRGSRFRFRAPRMVEIERTVFAQPPFRARKSFRGLFRHANAFARFVTRATIKSQKNSIREWISPNCSVELTGEKKKRGESRMKERDRSRRILKLLVQSASNYDGMGENARPRFPALRAVARTREIAG